MTRLVVVLLATALAAGGCTDPTPPALTTVADLVEAP